jgi:two-component system chemotaxis response regulator CheB
VNQLARSPLASRLAPPRDAYRVMVADDSAVVRGLLSRWLEEDPEIKVVGCVGNGAQALRELGPSDAEVVILDIDMPVMGGIEALPQLLTARPGVKIVVSSTLTRRNARISLKALSLGAADYMPKPDSLRGAASAEFKDELIAKVKALGAAARATDATEAEPARRKSIAPAPRAADTQRTVALRPAPAINVKCLAIASSTGGPQALLRFLSQLGGPLSVPVLVTQHMPPVFTTILAEHISRASGIRAKEGEEGEALEAGCIYVAPGGYHLTVRRSGSGTVVHLDDGPPESFCKPSANPMFRTVAQAFPAGALGLVLTGMGHDGCEGARAIVSSGGVVLVQDQATSVIWGMPGTVAEAGLASAALPIDELAPKVVGMIRGRTL